MEKVIYKTEEKEIEFKLDLERNTLWTTQSEIAKLFNVGRSWIARNIKDETTNTSTCSYYEQVAPNGKTYKMKHYSLSLILEIGYKIDVNKTLEFKEWTNNLLEQEADKLIDLEWQKLDEEMLRIQTKVDIKVAVDDTELNYL